MHQFRYIGNKLFCEGVAVETLAKKFGTPLLRLFAADVDGSFPETRCRARAAGPSGLFRDEGELQFVRDARAGESRQRFRRGERGRIAARHRGGRRSEELRFRRRGEDGERKLNSRCAREFIRFNCESEPELQRINRDRRAAEKNRAGCRARESRTSTRTRTQKSRPALMKTNLASHSSKSKAFMPARPN